MYNTLYLLNSNYTSRSKKRRWKVEKGTIWYTNSSSIIDFTSIASILRFISDVKNLNLPFKPKINFQLGEVSFTDKLTITVFECIMHSLIKDCRYTVALYGDVRTTISTESIKKSPLKYLWANKEYSIELFLDSFAKDITLDHYRIVIPEHAAEDSTLSKVMGDIRSVLSHRSIDIMYCDMLAEVLAELIGNATEHNADNSRLTPL